MAGRLSTGITGLDAQLGGGVRPGSVLLLLGEPLNAQELFTYHFIAQAEAGLYLSTQTGPDEIRAGLLQVDGDPEPITLKPGLDVKKLPAGSPDRIVFDSLSAHALQNGWDATWALLEEIRVRVRKAGGTALVTVVPELHSAAEVARLRLWADGVMEMGLDRQGFGIYTYLLVKKMRGVPDAARLLLFKDTDKGLSFESTRRVF
jgi:archaeal flagellar protein FlaH